MQFALHREHSWRSKMTDTEFATMTSPPLDIMNKAKDGRTLSPHEALRLTVWMSDWLRNDGKIRCAEADDWVLFRRAVTELL